MAVIIGSDNTTAFSSTRAYGGGTGTVHYNGYNPGENPRGKSASSTATASKVGFSISSWGTVANIKICIYDNSDNLAGVATVSSSEGTGDIVVDLDSTFSVTSGNTYYCGFYRDTAADLTLNIDNSDTSAYHIKYDATGSYASPVDPLPDGTWVASSAEFAWWVEDAGAGGSSSDAAYYYQRNQ